MSTFMIDSDDNITVFGSLAEVAEQKPGVQSFSSAEELARLAADWPASRLVEIWNSLPGARPVKKFTDRKTAVARIWKAIQSLTQDGSGRQAGSSPERRSLPMTSAAARTQSRSSKTKTDQIIALLKKPVGANLKAIMRVTGWQAHSVRGFISGQLVKRLGLRVKSFKRDGERVYSIRS